MVKTHTPEIEVGQGMIADFIKHPSISLVGPTSSGKTTAGLLRLRQILADGDSVSSSTLILVPQKSLAEPYQRFLHQQPQTTTHQISIQTMSSVVRRMIDLFWPIIASRQIFRHPFEPPRFLTHETAQYYMAQIVDPLIDSGHFTAVTLTRNRLFSQLLDNLNKSAIVGFSHTELADRLKSAWTGSPAQLSVYDDVQLAISAYRTYCLETNLVDFSLQVELFRKVLWQNATFQNYFRAQYQHLIYDNAEEDPPYVHDVVASWMKSLHSTLIILDEGAGLRSFLGADPVSATELASQTAEQLRFDHNFVSPPAVQAVISRIQSGNIHRIPYQVASQALIISSDQPRFFPQLLQSVSAQIVDLIQSGTPADQIVVLSPFLSDPLVFELSRCLSQAGVRTQTLRPSAALNSHPIIKTLLALAAVAHPEWELTPDRNQMQTALTAAIPDLDYIRASLILESGSQASPQAILQPLDTLREDVKQRVPSSILTRYEQLRAWLASVDQAEPLDHLISRLFSDLLTHPGFGFAGSRDAGEYTARLIQSYQKFKRPVGTDFNANASDLGKEFYLSLSQGLLSALYLPEAELSAESGVLIAPVISFLMQNRAVEYQFWLNLGSKGWYERLEQPLTHPLVLNRQWLPGSKWSTDDELRFSRLNLDKTLLGLLYRLKRQVFLCTSEYSESGTKDKGLLLTWAQNLFRSAIREETDD